MLKKGVKLAGKIVKSAENQSRKQQNKQKLREPEGKKGEEIQKLFV